MMMKRSLPAFLLFCLSALPLTGCAHAQAKTASDLPALAMPAPPPRDVEPSDVDAPPPVTPPPAEPALTPPARPRPAPPAARPDQPRQEPAKQEPGKIDPPAEPVKPDEAAKAPATLQTTPATAENEVERGIRSSLQRATSDLNRVDYRALNADAKNQYDTAKRFVRQADAAIRTKNLVFAKNLAEKAATIAAQLAGR